MWTKDCSSGIFLSKLIRENKSCPIPQHPWRHNLTMIISRIFSTEYVYSVAWRCLAGNSTLTIVENRYIMKSAYLSWYPISQWSESEIFPYEHLDRINQLSAFSVILYSVCVPDAFFYWNTMKCELLWFESSGWFDGSPHYSTRWTENIVFAGSYF